MVSLNTPAAVPGTCPDRNVVNGLGGGRRGGFFFLPPGFDKSRSGVKEIGHGEFEGGFWDKEEANLQKK